MNLDYRAREKPAMSVPRVRGDEPTQDELGRVLYACSPRARG